MKCGHDSKIKFDKSELGLSKSAALRPALIYPLAMFIPWRAIRSINLT